jgi:hypothetical protein
LRIYQQPIQNLYQPRTNAEFPKIRTLPSGFSDDVPDLFVINSAMCVCWESIQAVKRLAGA